MKSELKQSYEMEMERIFEEMGKVDVNSDDYKHLVERLNELNSSINQDEILANDICKSTADVEMRKKELKSNNVLTGLKTVVEVGAIVVPAVVYTAWMNIGLDFEKTGAFTSTTFKGLIGKIKPGK